MLLMPVQYSRIVAAVAGFRHLRTDPRYRLRRAASLTTTIAKLPVIWDPAMGINMLVLSPSFLAAAL